MKELASLFETNQGGEISAGQTLTIDEALARTNLSDIPYSQTQNVMDYINTELLYNKVPKPIKEKLEKLLENLQSRNLGI